MLRCLGPTLLLLASTASAQAETAHGNSQLGPEASAAPVVGGSVVPPGKWPDAVAVLGTHGSCTGTLIAPDVVITAGHCAEIEPMEVIGDTTNYHDASGIRVAIKSVTAYPSWRTSYDVSVIVLAQPITTVEPRHVGTSCSFSGFSSNMNVHLVGFGLTDAGGTGTNSALNEAMAPVIDPLCSGGNGCKAALAPGGEFVAGGGGTDSCFGDSGGPVYLDTPRGPVVIGTVSRGVDHGTTPCGDGGIYIRTDKVLAWIEATAGHAVLRDTCDADPEDPTADDATAAAAVSAGCSAGGASGAGTMIVLGIAILGLRRRVSRRSGSSTRRWAKPRRAGEGFRSSRPVDVRPADTGPRSGRPR